MKQNQASQTPSNIIFRIFRYLHNNLYKLRPSLISIYIIKEQMPAMLVGVVFFTFVFIINKIIILLSLLIEKNVPAKYSLELFFLMLPFSMALTVPIAILMATIMAMGRLSSDSEVIAMRASGISYYRIYRSLVFMGLLYTIFLFFFNDNVLPYANHRYRVLYDEIARSQPVTLLDEKVFNKIPSTNQTIYIHKIDKQKKEMLDVIIFRENRNKGTDIILAKRARWLKQKKGEDYQTLRLFNGTMHSPDRGQSQYSIVDFSSRYMDIHIKERGIGNFASRRQKSEREKRMTEIYNDLQKFIQKFPAPYNRKVKKEIAYRKLEFWKHLSIPFACLALTLIGAPLGIVSHRSGRGMGFGLAVVVSFIYYLLLMLGERFVKTLDVAPWFGAWLPVVTVSMIGALLIYFRNSAESIFEAFDSIVKKIFIRKKKKIK